MSSSPVVEWGKNFAEKFDLSHTKIILDLGCRQGELSAHLARCYPQQKFTAIANQTNEIIPANQRGLANLMFDTTPVSSLCSCEDFDAVVSFNCLHWVKDKIQVLKNIYQALKPGGRAYLQFFAIHGRPQNDRFFYHVATLTHWSPYFKNFVPDYFIVTIGEFTAILQSLGFMVHSMEFVRHQTTFANADIFLRWLETWASHQKKVPKNKSDHFLHETVQTYLDCYRHASDHSFPYYEYFLEVICEKPAIVMPASSQAFYQYGKIVFTAHEAFVLKHFLQGKTAKEIALLRCVTAKAIEFHLSKIKEKLNAKRRSHIYQAALLYGFIDLIFDTKL